MDMKDLRNVQLVLKDVLKEIDAICSENNIKYYLMYGSLIGAVRHSGAIPWDMDIDIALPRSDYNLFTKVAPKCLDKRFYLQNSISDPNCNITSARVQVVGSRVFENEKSNAGINNRFHVDIYPLDYVKEFKGIKAKFINYYVLFLIRLKNFKMGFESVDDNRTLLKKIVLHLSNILSFWAKGYYFDRWVENILIDKTSKSKHVSVIHTIYGYLHDLYEPEWFEESIKCEYEDLIVKIPVGFDKILNKTYGDYMTPPPENRRYDPKLEKMQVEFGDYYTKLLNQPLGRSND